MTKTSFIGRIIPNGKCSHDNFFLLVTVPDDSGHDLQKYLKKQVKVTIESI